MSECDVFKSAGGGDRGDYEWIRWMRIGIICFSAFCLFLNVSLIFCHRQYKFNTIKLFMFVEILYIISLLSVTPHDSNFSADIVELPKNRREGELMDCLIEKGVEYRCAIEGYVNLTCYSLSYWFAVCITLYIRHVLEDTHRQFIKRQGPFIFVIAMFIVSWYLVPFILSFFKQVPFSFGPTGYGFEGRSYLFYSGIISREKGPMGQLLVVFWMLTLPLALFIYHAILLFNNRKKIKILKSLDEINPRQFFLIKSGNLSLVIFLVQMVNVIKLVVALFTDPRNHNDQIIEWILFVINTVFDLLALVLIGIYFRYYYREGRALQETPMNYSRQDASLADSLFI